MRPKSSIAKKPAEQVVKDIRLLHPTVPIVIFSASDAEASGEAQVDAVLTKSRVGLDKVVGTVRALISAAQASLAPGSS